MAHTIGSQRLIAKRGPGLRVIANPKVGRRSCDLEANQVRGWSPNRKLVGPKRLPGIQSGMSAVNQKGFYRS